MVLCYPIAEEQQLQPFSKNVVHILFLQKDLIHTIGESAALGAAGFVIWGDLNLTSSRVGVRCVSTNLDL